MKRVVLKLSIMLLLITSCSKPNKMFISHNSQRTGIDFSNTLKNTPDLNILNYLYYYNGAGISVGDFNNDNLPDLFFTGNQVSNELYLNYGNFRFKKVTKESGLDSVTTWSNGAVNVDINNDGLLDLYLCTASNYRNLKGRNLLYINEGTDKDGVPKFREAAAEYGLDFSGLSTHAAFFDYDLDGDLDMYLLNHSVHPNRNYGFGNLREKYDSLAGDILFQNQNGYFVDVSKDAKIFQGRIGYGLGLGISDVNNDGYPDIYVGNDFFENDYLYINQRNGTFKEIISQDPAKLGHTTHFSMGNTLADINNDGLVDVLSLDMLPKDLITYKSSGLEYAYPIYRQYLNKGYAPQYMQNTLHLNLGTQRFAEIGNLSGVAASEWSWGVLAADFDLDGFKDLYVSNGILGATNDMDYMNFIANEDIQKRIDSGLRTEDLPLVNEIPPKKVSNHFFKNNGDLTFEDVTEDWFEPVPSFSNGSVFVDLDNDGDLDIATNNVNAPANILENKAIPGNYLKFQFDGPQTNKDGIGAKLTLYGSLKQVQENFTTKGYMSSVTPEVFFGLGKDSIIDSLKVQWPDGKMQTLSSIKSNQTITLKHQNSTQILSPKTESIQFLYKNSIIPFKHEENISLDFDREPLIPFAESNAGPCISVVDFDKDGFQDVFLGGAKKQPSGLFKQNNDGTFRSIQSELFEESKLNEDTSSVFLDINGDGWEDLLVASAGNEFIKGDPIRPRLYLNQNGVFKKYSSLDFVESNISSIAAADIDNDNDLDLLLTSDRLPGQFGKSGTHYLLSNDGKGNLTDVTSEIAPQLNDLGTIKEAHFTDFNSDGKLDIVALGHWMPISILMNDGKSFRLQKDNGLETTYGWWNTIQIVDLDNDGDLDFVAGNWGLNSKFRASEETPLKLYRNDFDNNGSIEPLVTYYHGNTETPFASKDELVKQMPFLNKEFLSYSKFASASLEQLFGKDKLDSSVKKKVTELRSCYFENLGDGKFIKKTLPLVAQFSQINEILIDDFNEDGFSDILLMGNNYHINTQLGRLDALHGLLLANDGNGSFEQDIQHLKVDGQVNSVEELIVNGKKGFIIGINDHSPIFLTKSK